MSEMTRTILKGLRHGMFLGMTGNRARLRAMRVEIEQIQKRLSLSETPDQSSDAKRTRA